MNRTLQKKVFLGVSALLLVIVTVPLLRMSHYTFIFGDDLGSIKPSLAQWKENHSLIQVLKLQFAYAQAYYRGWGGTFSMEWFGTSLMVIMGDTFYWVGTYITLLGLILSELFLFMLVGTKALGADMYDTGVVSCWLIMLQIEFVPYPVEAYYWMCGAILYTVGFSFTFLLYALMFLFLRRGVNPVKVRGAKGVLPSVFLQLGILFLSFVISFGNFVSALFGFTSCLLLIFGVWFKKHPAKWVVTLDGLFYMVFFVLNVTAPGNRYRMDSAGAESMGAVKAIAKSLLSAANYILVNMYPTIMILILMMLPFMICMVRHRALSGAKTFRFPLVFSAVSFGLYACQYVPNMYSLGILGAGRVINLYRYTAYIWIFLNVIYWIGWILRRLHEEKPEIGADYLKLKKSHLLAAEGSLLVLFCFAAYYYGGSTITSVSAVQSIRSGQAKAYHEEYLERLEILQDPEIRDAVLEPYTDPPYLIYLDDIKEDPTHYSNGALADFYGKASVRLRK